MADLGIQIVVDANGVLTSTSYVSGSTDLIIPRNVVEIKLSALSNIKAIITSLYIPNTVTRIHYNSTTSLFKFTVGQAQRLVSVIFEDGFILNDPYNNPYSSEINTKYWGANNFSRCVKLTTLHFEKSNILSLASSFAVGCTSLVDIRLPEKLTYIGSQSFFGCSSLREIIIPATVEVIALTAFKDCTSLTSIIFLRTKDTGLAILETNCFLNTGITVDNCQSVSEMLKLGYTKDSLITAGIPENVIDVANNNNNFLILSEDKTIIESYDSSVILTGTIKTPDTVKTIKDYALSGYTYLTSIIISDSVTTINEYAFSQCTSLTNVTLLRTKKQELTILGKDCFLDTKLTVDSVTKMYLMGYSVDNLITAGIPENIVTSASCFSEHTKILCLNLDSNEAYIPVKNLKKGDLVKTYLHGYRKINIMCQGLLKNNINEFRGCMYKMKKTDENGLIDDLIITGGHSIMVDELTKEEYDETNKIWKIYKVDNKYLLMAGISNKFEQIQGDEIFKYYHFSLENDGNPLNRYGVFANGVLVETPSEIDIKTFKNVMFI